MFRVFLLFAAALSFASALFAQGAYVIDRFHTDVQIQKDATIRVREEITATFKVERRGIYRRIPIVMQLEGGLERAVHIYDISVTDQSGNGYKTQISRDGDYLQIRIGDENVFFQPGTSKTYFIEYEVYGAFNWFDDWDGRVELYWNCTGSEWDTSIGEASFSFSFPSVADSDQISAKVFAGAYGSRNSITQHGNGTTSSSNLGVETTVTESGVTGSCTRVLMPYVGLTSVVSLPASVVPKPTQMEEFTRRANEYLALFTPLFVALILLPFWFKTGRDERDGPPTVFFEPPDGLPAAEAGTMIDEQVDKRDLAAGIMALAVKGYLTIEPHEVGTFIKKREVDLRLTDKTIPVDLSKFEEELYVLLAKGGTQINKADIQRNVGPKVGTLKKSIYNDLVDRGFYQSSPYKMRSSWIFRGILLSAAVTFLLFSFSLTHEVWTVFLGGFLGIGPAVWIGWHMPQRTRHGTKVRRQLLGFYEMMRHREHYMRWILETQPDGLKYEEYLPYAVAFDLVEEWNDAFKDILKEPPSWYHDPYHRGFYMHDFGRDLSCVTSDLGAAASTPPRSSGGSGGSSGFSSGGGFSGGGFGGGGGGSW